MLNNDINENDLSDNVSVHSIVSDQPEFDSDNESPSDHVNQTDKIIYNHVVKTIIDPGHGVFKPSKFDFVKLTYKCYFKETNEVIIDTTNLEGYIFKIVLPYGIIKAIKFMRKEEKSSIVLEPKFGFRKVTFDKLDRYLDLSKIPFKDDEEKLKEFFERLKKSTLVYIVELLDFIPIYDLSGNQDLMKSIITESTKAPNRPTEDSEVEVNMKLISDSQPIVSVENFAATLTKDSFNDIEDCIIKSMKKREKCRVDVTKAAFKKALEQKSAIMDKLKEMKIDPEKLLEKRIRYEVELLNFKKRISYVYYKDYEYKTNLIQKGIGNMSPWTDALVMLVCHIVKDGEVIYSNIPQNDSLQSFTNKMKELKQKIKKIPFFDTQAQFIVDSELKNLHISTEIYDPFEMNFPLVFREEILQSMKPLSIINVEYEMSKENLEANLFRFDGFDFLSHFDFAKKPKYEISFTCCLLNFEENVFVLNNKLIEDKVSKLNKYKEVSNGFYKSNFFKRAKEINKEIVDMYIKFLNIGTQGDVTFNDGKTKDLSDVKESPGYNKEVDEVIRKMFSNLILILYLKLDDKSEAEKYIEIFLKLYHYDEKVVFYQFKIKNDKGDYDSAKKSLELLVQKVKEENPANSNLPYYESELQKVESKIVEGKKNNINYMKKMIKSL